MSAAPRAWVLNLDAELELEAGARYTPSEGVRAQVLARARALAATLPAEDVVITPRPTERDSVALDVTGRAPAAWCPTPRALRALGGAGLALPDVPSAEVLRRVHERGFAHALSEGELPGAIRALDPDAIAAHVSAPGATGEWLLKRAFGVAGRGQRPVRAGALSDADRSWITASLRRGDALYVEPRVAILREHSVHGWAMRGRAELRSIREQRVSPDRAWTSSEPARALDPGVERALVDAAERAGAALCAAGYHGPFGVDAYLWRAADGRTMLRTISEINARFCMGWDARDGWEAP